MVVGLVDSMEEEEQNWRAGWEQTRRDAGSSSSPDRMRLGGLSFLSAFSVDGWWRTPATSQNLHCTKVFATCLLLVVVHA